MVHTRRLKQAGDQACHDRAAPCSSTIGPGVSEVGHDGDDAGCGSSAGSIDEREQLREMLIHGRRRRLDDDDRPAARRLAENDLDFAVLYSITSSDIATGPTAGSYETEAFLLSLSVTYRR